MPESTVAPVSAFPAWFQAEQAAALAEYESTPAPTRRDEAWRFANLKALDLSAFVPAPPVASEGKLITASTGLGGLDSNPSGSCAARLIFGNDTLVHREAANLPEGVIVKPLPEAATENEALFREYFMALPVELGSHKYAQLHRARLAGGVLVYVPKNVEVALPIELFHWVEGENSSVFPHTLIVLGDNAKVTVIDHFKSADNARAFACGINDFHLARGAQLTYVAVQDWSRDTLAFHLNSTLVGRDASATALIENFGGGYVRGESFSKLAGEGARSIMLSLNPADGTRFIDQRTLQDHVAPDTFSDLLYRNSLDDRSQVIFAGLIRPGVGAARTDGYQKMENLMLSEDAVAHAMPGLEILTDDVRCTHGATSGGVSADELFYMQARGISENQGRRLIVAGFFNSLLERIEDASLREKLGDLLRRRFGVI